MIVDKLKNIGLIVLIVLITACESGGQNEPPELKQAIKASASLLAKNNLSRSAFYAAYPDGKPSDYVKFYFSSMGAAEWPPYEGGGEFTVEEMKMARITPIPQDVHIYPDTVDENDPGKQVVIKGDDQRGVIIFEGYLSPNDEQAAIVVERKLLKVDPSGLATMTFQSNREMGVDY